MKKQVNEWVLVGIITAIALLPRVVALDTFLSPDEPQWEKNTLGFRETLLGGTWKGLYEQPHPGITTMWLAAPVIENPNWGIKRLPQAIALSVLTGVLTLLCIRIWGKPAGTSAGLLIALNSQFIAHSRVMAMDALLAGFMALSLLAYLMWQKTSARKYIMLSGAAAAAAVLSKVSGVLIVGYIPLLLLIEGWQRYKTQQSFKTTLVAFGWWAGTGIVVSIMIFPTLLTDFGFVTQEMVKFFTTEHYLQTVHALGPHWYPQTIAIFSTPLNWIALIVVPFTLIFSSKKKGEFTLIGSIILFFLLVQYSVKKGDRYLLPDFILFDILSAVTLVKAYFLLQKKSGIHKKAILPILSTLVIVAFAWQVKNLVDIHPYYLAYRNPFTRSLTVGRTMGWGEGLDLAAAHLNEKPGASDMLVAAYYEGPFAYHFKGNFTSAERLGKETAQEIGAKYVVLYRTMEGRAKDRWETKVLAEYKDKTPEHVISLNSEEYVWIYATP